MRNLIAKQTILYHQLGQVTAPPLNNNKSFSLLKVKLQLLSAILFICSPLSKELLSYLASLS